jgi:uroporphyrinogen decarboxylase
MSEMTDAQRIRTLLEGKKPDRVPFFSMGGGGFALVSRDLPLAVGYNDFDTALKYYREAAVTYGWLYTPLLAYAAMGSWEFGGDIKWPDGEFGQAPSVIRHPVYTPEEALALTLPDIPTAGMVPRQKQYYDHVLQQPDDIKSWRLICQVEGVFTLASNLAEASLFFKWMIKHPDVVHHLLGLALEFLSGLGQYIKDTYGTDNVLVWGGEPSTSNQLISPKMFEAFALPYTLELHQRLLGMGFRTIFKHICGDQNMNLPHWSKVPMGDGPGLVSFGHEVDLHDAAGHFPNDIIVGNLNPAVIQTATAEDVYKTSLEILEKGKGLNNGFIFAPGCGLPPKSPPENLAAIKFALEDGGKY